jgi:hypothetical protein
MRLTTAAALVAIASFALAADTELTFFRIVHKLRHQAMATL